MFNALAEEILADYDLAYLMGVKSSFTHDEDIIWRKALALFGGVPYKAPSKVWKTIQLISIIVYTLGWFVGYVVCVVANAFFIVLIGETWNTSYAGMSSRACNLMSLTGFIATLACAFYMWFGQLGQFDLPLSPQWLTKKIGIDW